MALSQESIFLSTSPPSVAASLEPTEGTEPAAESSRSEEAGLKGALPAHPPRGCRDCNASRGQKPHPRRDTRSYPAQKLRESRMWAWVAAERHSLERRPCHHHWSPWGAEGRQRVSSACTAQPCAHPCFFFHSFLYLKNPRKCS